MSRIPARTDGHQQLSRSSAPSYTAFSIQHTVYLHHHMTIILESSLEEGKIPDILKLGFICPIQKPGAKREQASSWRPISLTSHRVKTMERELRKGIVSYLEVNNLMDPDQHGSRSNRSCLSPLLQHQDEILRMLETVGNVDVIYTDLEIAT